MRVSEKFHYPDGKHEMIMIVIIVEAKKPVYSSYNVQKLRYTYNN